MNLLIVVLAVLLFLGALLGGVAGLPLVLIAIGVVIAGFILVRAMRGKRIAPR